MPLTHKGEDIKSALVKEYGEKKGEQVLYAGKNKGTFTGIDTKGKLDKIADAVASLAEDGRRLRDRVDSMGKRRDK